MPATRNIVVIYTNADGVSTRRVMTPIEFSRNEDLVITPGVRIFTEGSVFDRKRKHVIS